MSDLGPDQFGAFFRELHGQDPFPWQERLARRVCETGWPASLDLPTATGKTACLDVAVFAMAVRLRGPRRVFYVVDRRVVVDAAFARMEEMRKKLRAAGDGVLGAVAGRLRAMAQGEEPLEAFQLRGGIYRDDSWVRSPLQPTLIASTVDQVGSRLLFRGYGVSDTSLPIHAGLAANDALILLDEAHCSRPFSDTVAAIRRYREWTADEVQAPFEFVEMTATPVAGGEGFGLEDEDYRNPKMHKRLYARKAARLVVSKARAKDFDKLAEHLVEEAERLAEKPRLRRIAIMVNRVRTARLAYRALVQGGRKAHLLIGRMRPVDRELTQDVKDMLSGKERNAGGEPVFVVATQCLEVGADLDFDALVTECASIDALLQRFGRLDRIGELGASGVTAEGRVVMPSWMLAAKQPDPIYGEALGKTWKWLQAAGEEVEFGLCSEAGNCTVRERLKAAGAGAAELQRMAPTGPALLPAHLDVLVQTSPRPALEPHIHLYLHGKENASPEVQVVWRGDLDTAKPEVWGEIVSMCPPVSAEAMAVPLWDFRRWVAKAADEGGLGGADVEGAGDGQDEAEGELRCEVLRWRGSESERIKTAGEIRPGDTLILAEASGGWEELGHIPDGRPIDAAEQARLALRRGWILRLHPALMALWPETEARRRLMELTAQPDAGAKAVMEALAEYREELPGTSWLREMLRNMPRKAVLDAYPEDAGGSTAWVLSGRFAEPDAGQDESSASVPVPLDRHLAEVTAAVRRVAEAVVAEERLRGSLIRAAELHDCGKADGRFQALLHGGDTMAAQFAPKLLAKGSQARRSAGLRRAQWARSGLPEGFRHELVSLLLAGEEDCLTLHLIASHHGRCRPFAPVVEDDGGDVVYDGRQIAGEERRVRAAHRLGSGVADRFWTLTRRYGWWGLAYLEALVRLGDWTASRDEAEGSETV